MSSKKPAKDQPKDFEFNSISLEAANKIISKYDINIKGQYLKTVENIGYVITDIDREYDKSVVKELKNITNTIKLRVLY